MNSSVYKRVKCEAICLTAKAWLKLGHATGLWSQAQKQIYNSMAEKEKFFLVFIYLTLRTCMDQTTFNYVLIHKTLEVKLCM